jgi:hypothetical protein
VTHHKIPDRRVCRTFRSYSKMNDECYVILSADPNSGRAIQYISFPVTCEHAKNLHKQHETQNCYSWETDRQTDRQTIRLSEVYNY